MPTESALAQWRPWLLGIAALAPFLWWHRQFGELFWFGDDLFLVDQIAGMGFWEWTGQVFSENFVPLFKFLWGGAMMTFGGSYLAMLWLLWLTHALNTALLGRVLTQAGFPRFATLVTQLVFGLSSANLETLGWSVQWSAVLATTFLLFGLLWQERHATVASGFSWKLHPVLMGCAAASACCFSRGVLTGPVLALAVLLPIIGCWHWRVWLAKAPGVFLTLLPAIAVALTISSNSSGNHQHMSGHWHEALSFGLSYFLFNPAYALLGAGSLHPVALLAFAGLKLGAIVAALMISRGRVRQLLWLLLAFDVGNSVLLGVGRYHTGFLAALSSRYQYGSLLATLPFITLLASRALDYFPLQHAIRRWLPVAFALVLAALCLRDWSVHLPPFAKWRGTEIRELMAAPATNDPAIRVPTLDFMHIERAKALQRAFDLH